MRDDFKLTVSQCVTADWCRGYNEAVDVMANDFESRICENCRDGGNCLIQEYASDVLGVEFNGCTQFVRKA